MRIERISIALPSKRVTNEGVLDKVREHSLRGQETDQIVKIIGRFLEHTGAKNRLWLDENETPLEVTLRACRGILDSLESPPPDLLIYASVFGELIEPANANLIASELGLDTVECFDLKEACEGWMKAAKIAQSFLRNGTYKLVLVVNAEFSLSAGYAINPNLFNVSSKDQLVWRFPGFTIGEAATATLLTADSEDWPFTNMTRNDLCDLCTVTAPWSSISTVSHPRIAKDGPGWFTSWGAELSKVGIPLSVEIFENSGINPDEVDILFTHCSSTRDWAEIALQIGLLDKIFDIYKGYGNVVSAGIPAAMALAIQEGLLKRGDRVAVLVASAGMTFSTAEFIF